MFEKNSTKRYQRLREIFLGDFAEDLDFEFLSFKFHNNVISIEKCFQLQNKCLKRTLLSVANRQRERLREIFLDLM